MATGSHRPYERGRIGRLIQELREFRDDAPNMAQSPMTYEQGEELHELGRWASGYGHAVAVKCAKQSGKSIARKDGRLKDTEI